MVKSVTKSAAIPPEPWMRDALQAGFAALQRGDTDSAADCCKRVLTARRDLPEAHFLVGLVALELGEKRTAVSAFGSVTELDSTHGAAWANLARLTMLGGQVLRAEAALEEAVRYADDNPTVLNLIGAVHTMLGDDVGALQWYAKAAVAAPDNVGFIVSKANCEMYVGAFDDAEASLGQALALSPHNANAHWILAGLRKAGDRRHIGEMRALIDSGRHPPHGLAFLYYALGKEYEDLEDWDAAFEAFENGARARRSTLDYDEKSETGMFAALDRLLTRDWLTGAGRGFDSEAPIFVVGQPRTGTTLVERIITAHPDVHSAGELRQFGNGVRRLSRYAGATRFSAELVEGAIDVEPRQLGEMYIETTKSMAGGTPRFVDKLPSNYIYLPLILAALPNAKIVHLRRNPMDACFSSYKQLFADAYAHSYDQEEMARHHARYFGLMETWRERFGSRFFDIAYEDVARDVEPNARALIDYLGLPWNDACLEFHKQATAVSTASAVQVRQPAHTKSIGRWRRYEKQLAATRATLESLGVPLETR